jgi:cyclic pyranopterin phosphate synthase
VEDAFGHLISYLRVSVTDRCNERCRYCMPEEEQAWFPKEEVLSYEEMLRVLRVGAGLGIKKVRVTGGEPLTRPGVADFCAQIAAIPGI